LEGIVGTKKTATVLVPLAYVLDQTDRSAASFSVEIIHQNIISKCRIWLPSVHNRQFNKTLILVPTYCKKWL